MGLFGRKPVWQKIHKDGMRLYSRCWGEECGAAEREGREPVLLEALVKLAATVFADDAVERTRTAEILTVQKGRYLSDTFRTHIGEIGGSLDREQIDKLAGLFDPDVINPVIVICRYIEATDGGGEAARYLAAVISGEAT